MYAYMNPIGVDIAPIKISFKEPVRPALLARFPRLELRRGSSQWPLRAVPADGLGLWPHRRTVPQQYCGVLRSC